MRFPWPWILCAGCVGGAEVPGSAANRDGSSALDATLESDGGERVADAGRAGDDAAEVPIDEDAGVDGGVDAGWAIPFDDCGLESTPTCVSAPVFSADGARAPFGNSDAERVLGPFGRVTNAAGNLFEQDIWDRGSPGEHERLEADAEHLYFLIPAGLGGSNGSAAATGATFNIAVDATLHATLGYKVRFEGAGFAGGEDIQRTPCVGDADGMEVHNDDNVCFRGGKLPGLGIGDDPRTGCRHAPNGGSFRVMFMDMDGAGQDPPELISYTYTQGTSVLGDPEEGSDRESTPDPNDRCGTQRSLSPQVFLRPATWYRVEVEVEIIDGVEGKGTYALRAYACDDAGEECGELLGALRRPADFIDEGTAAVTQILLHAFVGGSNSDPHWRLDDDSEIVMTDLTYTAHQGECPTYCR